MIKCRKCGIDVVAERVFYMLKSDLRERGYVEQERYQKSSVITAIWVVSALAMIAFVFVFAFLVDIWKMAGSDFAVLVNDVAGWVEEVFQQWKFALYMLLWALILLTLFFVTKLDLRKQKLTESSKSAKRPTKYILRAILVLLTLVASFYFLTLLSEMADPYNPDRFGATAAGLFEYVLYALSLFVPGELGAALAVFIYLILCVFLYLAMKLITTIFMCHDKKSGIKLKILNGTAMPVCACSEALSLKHILVSYLIPFVFMYSLLVGSCASTDNIGKLVLYTIVLVFMSIFMSYDLTLVIYSIYLKLRYKPDYISIDHHIYDVTLYRKSYVTGPAAKRRAIKKKRSKNSQVPEN